MLDFAKIRIAGHDGSFIFEGRGEGNAVCGGDEKFALYSAAWNIN
jgi:hypothetical protein